MNSIGQTRVKAVSKACKFLSQSLFYEGPNQPNNYVGKRMPWSIDVWDILRARGGAFGVTLAFPMGVLGGKRENQI